MWFRHRGPLDYSKIEFLNAAESIHLSDAIIKIGIDHISYSAYRIKADFQEAFTFHDYPFDSQILSIRFRHKRLNSNDFLFVADDIAIRRGKDIMAKRLEVFGRVFQPVFFIAAIGVYVYLYG